MQPSLSPGIECYTHKFQPLRFRISVFLYLIPDIQVSNRNCLYFIILHDHFQQRLKKYARSIYFSVKYISQHKMWEKLYEKSLQNNGF